MVMAGYTLV